MRLESRHGLWGMAAFALLFVLLLPGRGHAGLYHVVPCGGAFDPCSIVGSNHVPTADQLAGFNNQLLLDYYKPILSGQTGVFSTWITGASSSGYVIGSVSGPNSIHTQFVFYDGQMLCCWADSPFYLADINEGNTVVGWDPNRGMVAAYGGIGIQFGTDDLVRSYPDGQAISPYWHPVAIDDDGNILARCGYPECRDTPVYYELRVSEPGALALLLPMIAALALWPLARRSRTRAVLAVRA